MKLWDDFGEFCGRCSVCCGEREVAERGGSVVSGGDAALLLIGSCVCCCEVPTFSVAGRGRGRG